jgi:hypothetical protein
MKGDRARNIIGTSCRKKHSFENNLPLFRRVEYNPATALMNITREAIMCVLQECYKRMFIAFKTHTKKQK